MPAENGITRHELNAKLATEAAERIALERRIERIESGQTWLLRLFVGQLVVLATSLIGGLVLFRITG